MLHNRRRFGANRLFTITFACGFGFTIGGCLLHDWSDILHRSLRRALFRHGGLHIVAGLCWLRVVTCAFPLTITRRTVLAVAGMPVATSRLLAARLLILVFLAFRTIPATTTPTATAAFFASAFRPLVPGGTLTWLPLLHGRQRLLLLWTRRTLRTLRTRRTLLTVMRLAFTAALRVAIASLTAIATFAFGARSLVAVFASTAAFTAAFGP
jgi:drug/metabolite transporter superfamily protein YnfA